MELQSSKSVVLTKHMFYSKVDMNSFIKTISFLFYILLEYKKLVAKYFKHLFLKQIDELYI